MSDAPRDRRPRSAEGSRLQGRESRRASSQPRYSEQGQYPEQARRRPPSRSPQEPATDRHQIAGPEPDGWADPSRHRPSQSILRRREAALRVRARRLLLTDAGVALAIVLILLIAGLGLGMLGVVAIVVLLGFGIAALVRRYLQRRRLSLRTRRPRAQRARR